MVIPPEIDKQILNKTRLSEDDRPYSIVDLVSCERV